MADTQLTDPLGRASILHDATWNRHILKRHPELASHRLSAENAVNSPLSIWTSKKETDCRIYYGSGPRPNIMIAVICDMTAGIVKTAYFAKVMTGGTQEW